MHKSRSLGLLLAALCMATPVHADSLSAQQIIDSSTQNNAFGFANAVGKVTITLQKADGGTRIRQLEIRSLDHDGSLRTLLRFLTPADVAGTAFLVLENKGGEDEQYLYLPALAKTKRITGKQRDEKFMGTDLTYADIQAKNVRMGKLARLDDGDIGGKPVYVVSATPADRQDSPYSKTITYVHRESLVPLKVEFFDPQNKLQKVLSVRRLSKQGGHWVAMESLVQDVQKGSTTQVRVDSVSFDVHLTDSDFTQRALAGG